MCHGVMALSPEGTPSVEALGHSDPELPPEEPWQATCEIREPFLLRPPALGVS